MRCAILPGMNGTTKPLVLPGSRLMSVSDDVRHRIEAAAAVLSPQEVHALSLSKRGAAMRLVTYALDHLIRAYTKRPTDEERNSSAGLPAPEEAGNGAIIKGGTFPDDRQEV